jgi:hypothetical protein
MGYSQAGVDQIRKMATHACPRGRLFRKVLFLSVRLHLDKSARIASSEAIPAACVRKKRSVPDSVQEKLPVCSAETCMIPDIRNAVNNFV